jgi:hypothetical protein
MQFRGKSYSLFSRNSFKTKNTDSACMNSSAVSSVITTRSDWQSCIFCTNKRYKKDGKLHKVEYCGSADNAGDHSCLETYLTRACHLWKIMYQKHENVRVWRFYHNTRLCVVFHPFYMFYSYATVQSAKG